MHVIDQLLDEAAESSEGPTVLEAPEEGVDAMTRERPGKPPPPPPGAPPGQQQRGSDWLKSLPHYRKAGLCWKCGDPNHTIRNCPQPQADAEQQLHYMRLQQGEYEEALMALAARIDYHEQGMDGAGESFPDGAPKDGPETPVTDEP